MQLDGSLHRRLAATCGALALRISAADGQSSFRAWWVGDALGALIEAPLIIAGVDAVKARKYRGATTFCARTVRAQRRGSDLVSDFDRVPVSDFCSEYFL